MIKTDVIVKVPGVKFQFSGGVELTIPPLNLGALEQLAPRLEKYRGGVSTEAIGTVIDAALTALKRNYPEITREEVGDLVDMDNMIEVMACIMDVSGLKRKAQESALGQVKQEKKSPAPDGGGPLPSASTGSASPGA